MQLVINAAAVRPSSLHTFGRHIHYESDASNWAKRVMWKKSSSSLALLLLLLLARDTHGPILR